MFAHVLKMVLIDVHCKDNEIVRKFQTVNIHSQNNNTNPLKEKINYK